MPSLLIVGALTIDRFPDDRTAPGGSVLHAGLAAAAEGASLAFLTVAGPEAEARAGLDRLAELGTVRYQPAAATTAYRHEEVDGRRRLVYETAGGSIRPDDLDGLPPVDVMLLAPIASELTAAVVRALIAVVRPRLTVLLIQGWLRRLVVGEPAHVVRLESVGAETWTTFGAADAVVVSTEDLADAPGDPFVQAADLRARLGPKPLLVVTLGAEGYLLDDPGAANLVASVPRRVVEGVATVGAGDTFGAALALHLARGDEPGAAADSATERVIATLELRRA